MTREQGTIIIVLLWVIAVAVMVPVALEIIRAAHS